jgi:hypothetical protein
MYPGQVETWECLVVISTRRVKCVGTTWGISGDVCHICILCSFAGTPTTMCKLDSLELTTGMSATATAFTYVIYIWQIFSFGEERVSDRHIA